MHRGGRGEFASVASVASAVLGCIAVVLYTAGASDAMRDVAPALMAGDDSALAASAGRDVDL
eukprot:CAMPEP_0182883832 /NCGR_PEP_ID=MMETSP0034_2-20130328/18623_1 /TAXON_ID=156128 /ORGANISM="Nephroselmis pyriformis, Strain CCMP717" /LENGTH=61 /DNA_ID=CAMNT_0025016987 /DNA_START=90 /DNA_END=271 /DNA_ORIENTATION=-